MSTVEEIETAIEGLKESDVLRLAEWLKAKLAEAWDRRIALDANEVWIGTHADHDRLSG